MCHDLAGFIGFLVVLSILVMLLGGAVAYEFITWRRKEIDMVIDSVLDTGKSRFPIRIMRKNISNKMMSEIFKEMATFGVVGSCSGRVMRFELMKPVSED